MTFQISQSQDLDVDIKRELIPNDIVQQDLDETTCYSCGRSKNVFWNNRFRAMICIECDQIKNIIKKEGGKLIDEGISLVEFFSRLQSRIEVYGE